MQDGGRGVGDIGDRIWKKAVYIIFSFYLIKCNDYRLKLGFSINGLKLDNFFNKSYFWSYSVNDK